MGGNLGKDGSFVLMASMWKEDLDFVNDDIETIGYNEIMSISIGVVVLSLSYSSNTLNLSPSKIDYFEICVYSTVLNILHPC